MTAKEIEKILTGGVVIILARDAVHIEPDAPLHTLGVDSMGFVELLVFIEKKFNLKLIESGLTRKDFQSIRSMASCISRMKKTRE